MKPIFRLVVFLSSGFVLASCHLGILRPDDLPQPPVLTGPRANPDNPRSAQPAYLAFRVPDPPPGVSERWMEVWGGELYSLPNDPSVYGTASAVAQIPVPETIDGEIFRPSPRRDMVLWAGDVSAAQTVVGRADPYIAVHVYSVRGQRRVADLSEYPGHRVLRQGDCGNDTIAPNLAGFLRANGISATDAAAATWGASLGDRNSGTRQWLLDAVWTGPETLRLSWTMTVGTDVAGRFFVYGLEAFDLTFSVPLNGPARFMSCTLQSGPPRPGPLPRTIGPNAMSGVKMMQYGRQPVLEEGSGGRPATALLKGPLEAFLMPDPLVP